MSEALSRDALLAASKREYHNVEVEGVGTIRVQTLNDLEHGDATAAMFASDGKYYSSRLPNMRREIASKMMVDEHGQRMFQSASEVAELAPEIVMAVYRKHLEISDGGLAKEINKQKKD